MKQVTVEEFKANVDNYLDDVQDGVGLTITVDGNERARVLPALDADGGIEYDQRAVRTHTVGDLSFAGLGRTLDVSSLDILLEDRRKR